MEIKVSKVKIPRQYSCIDTMTLNCINAAHQYVAYPLILSMCEDLHIRGGQENLRLKNIIVNQYYQSLNSGKSIYEDDSD